MNNSNALERLSTIFCLLQTRALDASIEGISKALNIPTTVIREDIKSILEFETFSYLFNLDEVDDDDDDFYDDLELDYYDEIDYAEDANNTTSNEKSTRTSKRIIYNQKLLSKLTNDLVLYMDNARFELGNDCYPLYITHREKQLLSQYFPILLENTKNNLYMIKNSPAALEFNVDNKNDCLKYENNPIDVIQDAIFYEKYVKFRYKGSKDTTHQDYELAPKLLYHDINKGRMYMITLNENEELRAYRLDRMSSVSIINNRVDTTPLPEKILSRIDYLWSMDNDNGHDPVHVKIRIDGYSRNIIEKIQNDISRRKYAKLYQDGKYWYYEDDIIGLSSFRSWIYQYGSSMVVMEPVDLAQTVYNSALQRLKRYTGEQ